MKNITNKLYVHLFNIFKNIFKTYYKLIFIKNKLK